ncbi:putative DEAD-box ATP-dependent RNA helicase [Trifolium repens]|nr:putative DEAD-box ATP-dependent RNA helicase [Trifolium repens]
MNVLTPNVVQQLSFSFSKSLSSFEWQNKSKNVLSLTMTVTEPRSRSTVIRMGGGPRTYPGGVSKWQWKRMQAKKAKQLLKARLCRERQIYEMRKRAELKAAVSELERPWDVVEKPPKLFSIQADEQLKVLADRFQKPGGFDLWTENDGPQLFQTPDELPSARFFPKGVVHSIKPYMKVTSDDLLEGPDILEDDGGEGYWSEGVDDGEGSSSFPTNFGKNGVNVGGRMRKNGNGRRYLSENVGRSHDGEHSSPLSGGRNELNVRGGLRKNGNGRRYLSEDVDQSHDGERSSHLTTGRNELNTRGSFRKNGNGRRYMSEDVDQSHDRERSSHLSIGRNESNVRGGFRKNGRRYSSGDVDWSNNEEHSSSSSSSNYGRNGLNFDARARKSGNGRKFISEGVDGLDDAERSSPSRVRNGVSFDGKFGNKGSARRMLSKDVDADRSNGSGDIRSRRKESGRRFMSKDVNGSNAMHAGGDGSGGTQRGSNSIAGRSYGKYPRRISNNASPRVRDADSEVYDMGLQQDGSYQFLHSTE